MLKVGMLWFDNSQTGFGVKVQKAVDYYQKKYGRCPDMVMVHPIMVKEIERAIKETTFDLKLDGFTVTVRQYKPVLPGHIWIGIEDKS